MFLFVWLGFFQEKSTCYFPRKNKNKIKYLALSESIYLLTIETIDENRLIFPENPNKVSIKNFFDVLEQ